MDNYFKRPRTTKAGAKPQQKSSGTGSNASVTSNSSNDSSTLAITENIGDIFAAPSNTLLIHACNCQGSWSAGIAKAFKDRYPKAFAKYAAHCKQYKDHLVGDALLIVPPDDAFDSSKVAPTSKPKDKDKNSTEDATKADQDGGDAKGEVDPSTHFVGCVFTSRRFGRNKDSPKQILEATGPAMELMMQKVADYNASVSDESRKVKEVRMCKINSGLFHVPWTKTKAVLESIDVVEGGPREIAVWERDE